MEMWCRDAIAEDKCHGKKQVVVALAHEYLGMASVVVVTSVPEKEALKLEIGSGSKYILVDYALDAVLSKSS